MGFKMRSGNGPLAFKNMGSSPAKQGFMDALSAFKPESKTKDLKAEKLKTTDTTKGQANTNKPGSNNYTGTDKNTDKSHLSTKTTDKKGEVKTKASKNDGKGAKGLTESSKSSAPEPVLSAAEKAAKKEKRAQAFRDAGKLVSNIGSEESLVDVMQSQADKKVNTADKKIQNEKDRVNTARTQQLVDATNKSNNESEKLPETPKTAVTTSNTANVTTSAGENKSNNTSSVTSSKALANKNKKA